MSRTAIPLDDLPAWLATVSAAISADVLALHKQVVADVHWEVTQRTPVDVGTARSNWIVSNYAPASQIRRAYSPFRSRYRSPRGPGGTRAEQGNLRASYSAALVAVAPLRFSDHMTTYIVNNLPYAERLTEGWSRQSPRGLMMAGVAVGLAAALRDFRWNNLNRVR